MAYTKQAMFVALILSSLLVAEVACDPSAPSGTHEAQAAVLVQPGSASVADALAMTGPVGGEVKVTVDATGKLKAAEIYKSTANMTLDQALLLAARKTQYLPKLVKCQPMEGDYFYKFDFIPDKGDINAFTAKFRAFLLGAIAQQPPTGEMTDKLAAALTPSTLGAIASTYGGFGALKGLNFQDDSFVGGYHRYRYEAVFDGAKRELVFTTDKDGKIAGFFDITKPQP